MSTSDSPTLKPYIFCLEHATYHPAQEDCWGALVEFFLAHPDMKADELIDLYRLTVEVAMLNRFLRTGEI